MLAIVIALLLQDGGYLLPWDAGKTYEIVQGNDGTGTHFKARQYAFDFGLPAGTRVLATRAGTVWAVQDYSVGGYTVVISHEDGTRAVYAHLTVNSGLVKQGDSVLQGQPLALSGRSGLDSNAITHMHFHVAKESAKYPEGFETVPIKFDDVKSDAGVPKQGKSYGSGNSDPFAALAEVNRLAFSIGLLMECGAFGPAYARLERLTAMKVRFSSPVIDGAKATMDWITEFGRAKAKEIEALPIDDAVREVLLARRSFEGTPAAKAFESIALEKRDGYAAAQVRANAVVRAQESFYRGLKAELDGGKFESSYRDATSAAPDSDYARWALARLR